MSEPLAKQKDANNKNGVVGNTGSTTPIAPSTIDTIPIISHKSLIGDLMIFFINVSMSFLIVLL